VLLDTRRDAHRGDGPASSFEWAVSAAASVGVYLSSLRYGVRLLHDERAATWTGPYQGDSAGLLLDELAVVTLDGPETLQAAVTTLTRSGGDGLVVAVLGEVEEGTATTLARLGRHGAKGIAVLVRTTEWTTLPPARAAELDGERTRVMAILRDAGWAVTDGGPHETISEAWQRVSVAGTRFAGAPAASLAPTHGTPARVGATNGATNGAGSGRSGNGSSGNGFGGNGQTGNRQTGNGYGNGQTGNGYGGNGNGGNGHALGDDGWRRSLR
jgi:hypothetical protein